MQIDIVSINIFIINIKATIHSRMLTAKPAYAKHMSKCLCIHACILVCNNNKNHNHTNNNNNNNNYNNINHE